MGNENNKMQNITIKNSSKNKNKSLNKNNSLKYEFQKLDNKADFDLKIKKPKRFATVFRWDGDGNNAYLTGSFCDWHQFFEMEKFEDPENKKNNKFFLTLFLPKGAYQYKFKIDDQWKCNSNFPTCSDKNGNINNIIDLTKQKKEEGTTDFSTSYVTTGGFEQKSDETKYLNFSQYLENECYDNDKELSIISAKSNEISNNFSFENNFDIMPKQKNLMFNQFTERKEQEEKEEQEEQDIINNNYSYRKIIPLGHEYIDHLIMNKITFNKNKNNKNFVSSCSFRYGFKTTTIIYYSPKIKSRKKNG